MLLASFLVIRNDNTKSVEKPTKQEEPLDQEKDKSDENPPEQQPTTSEGKPEEEPSSRTSERPKATFEPITLKITTPETQKGRDLLEFIRRSVKPAVEVRAWMTEQIQRCMRSERRYLALRLPHKSQIREGSGDEEGGTPAEVGLVEKARNKAPRKSIDRRPKEKDGAAADSTATATAVEKEKEKEKEMEKDTDPGANAGSNAEKADGTVEAETSSTSVPVLVPIPAPDASLPEIGNADASTAKDISVADKKDDVVDKKDDATETAETAATAPTGRKSTRKKSSRISDAQAAGA